MVGATYGHKCVRFVFYKAWKYSRTFLFIPDQSVLDTYKSLQLLDVQHQSYDGKFPATWTWVQTWGTTDPISEIEIRILPFIPTGLSRSGFQRLSLLQNSVCRSAPAVVLPTIIHKVWWKYSAVFPPVCLPFHGLTIRQPHILFLFPVHYLKIITQQLNDLFLLTGFRFFCVMQHFNRHDR